MSLEGTKRARVAFDRSPHDSGIIGRDGGDFVKSGRTLQPEDLLSHYRVVGPLGAGGMGEVYLARDQSLERNVALKVLPPEMVKSEERVRRFVLEAKSASSLSHPNIVTVRTS